MTCLICGDGECVDGEMTALLERGSTVLVVKHVPARVCENCGEAWVDEESAGVLLQALEMAVAAGVQVDVREFVAA